MNVNDGTVPCDACGNAVYPSAIKAFYAGGAVALGLIGMAEAIRTRPFDPFASYRAGRDRSADR